MCQRRAHRATSAESTPGPRRPAAAPTATCRGTTPPRTPRTPEQGSGRIARRATPPPPGRRRRSTIPPGSRSRQGASTRRGGGPCAPIAIPFRRTTRPFRASIATSIATRPGWTSSMRGGRTTRTRARAATHVTRGEPTDGARTMRGDRNVPAPLRHAGRERRATT